MADNFVKTKRHVLTDDGYKTLSQWTNANSVEMDNGNSVQTEVTNLKNTATTSANGLMSSADKKKLDTIATSANNYTHPTYTSSANGLKKITVDGTGHVSSTAAVEKTDITSLGIPAQDTTYAAATTEANGLMTYDQVIKLNGIAASANNYSHPTYTSAASALRKFTVDSTGHVSATAAVAKSDITALGIPDSNTTYAAATTAAAGLMTSADKSKLDGIADNANNYTHPTYTSAASGLYKVAVDGTGHISGATAVEKADITALGIPDSNTTYATVTTKANGLMTKDDKIKLDSISASANNYIHPSYTPAASGLYKVTVDNTGHVSGATAVEASDITDLGIAATDTTYADATTAAAGLMTSADKSKLDSIAASANKYTHPSYTSAASGLYKVTVDGTGHVSGTAAVEKADITALGIPASNTTYNTFTSSANGLVPAAKSGSTSYLTSAYVLTGAGWQSGTKYNTDTTYAAVTASANGLMTSTDKSKLDTIAASANNYSHPTYTSAASGLYKVAVDETGHVNSTSAVEASDITGLGIAATDTTYADFTSAASGLVPAAKSGTTNYATSGYVLTGAGWKAGTKYNTDNNTTYAAVTASANGLMTSTDKSKLDAIAASANNYTHPSYTSSDSGLKKFTVDATGHVSATAAVEASDITSLGIAATDTTYANFTSAAAGLVPAAKNGTTNYATSGYVLTGAGWKAGTKYNTDNNTTYAAVTTAANGLMTSADKSKLDGIAAGAQVNSITGIKGDSESTYRTGNVNITPANIGAIPSSSIGANNGIAPLNASGLIDSTYLPAYVDDVLEFNGTAAFPTTGTAGIIYVDTSQQENNIYRWSGTSYIVIAKNTDTTYTISKSGNSITLTGSNGYSNSVTDTTYAAATTAAAGLMTSADKSKLDSIAASANKYTHPSYTSSDSGLKKFTVDATGHVSATAAVAASDITGLGIPAQDTTYANFTSAAAGLVPEAKSGTTNYATSAYVLTGAGWKAGTKYNTDNNTTYAAVTASANGLMTSTDKSKLDNIAASANNYTHPSYTSAESGLYKVTVDATGHVSGTAAVEKTDITALGIPASNTTYNTFTSSANGLVPAAKSGSTSYLTSAYVLTGAGWQAGTKYNTDTTYANYSSAAAGLVPAPTAAQATTGYVLTGTGWQAGTKYNTDNNTTYAAVTSTANGLMSKDDKIKLDAIAASANNYTHPSYTSAASGFRKFTVDATGHVSATAAVAQSDITGLGIPTTATFASATAGLVPAPTADQATSGYVLTGAGWQAGTKYNTDNNTTYANFTSAAAGLVPAAASGSTNIATSGYVLTGAGWKAGTKYNTDNNTTYAAVTASANGLMTSTDKSKLDAIAASANNYTHPTYTSSDSGLKKFTVDDTGHVSATAAVTASDITGLGIAATDTTYANFTSAAAGLVPEAKSGTTNYATSGYVLTGAGWKAGTKYNTDNNTTYAAVTTAANGLMTSTDKSKLDAIAASANNYSHPSYTSYASGLYKVTVDATGHVSGTAAVEKTDITALGIPTSNTTYATFTSAANGLVPAAKSGTTNYATSGYVLTGAGWAAGTKYNTDTNTTYANFGSGSAGLVPAPTADQATSGYVLTGTGWQAGAKYNTDTTYAAFTSAANGLVPAAKNGTTNLATTGYVLTGAGWAAGTKYNVDNNTTYAAVTTAANGLMTSTDKSKLDNIAASANNYSHPTYTSAASGLYKVAVDGTGHVSGATAISQSDITGLGIPTTATYTSAANGLVPAAKSGSTSYLTSAYVLTGAGWQAGTKYNTDTTYANFTSAAAGLVPAAKNGTTNYATSGYVLTGAGWAAGTKYNTDNNTTYAAVTTAANGLMTSTDKSKLDAIAASANNYTHPSYTSAASGFRKFTVDDTGHVSATAAVAQSDITGLGIPTTATFTSAASGLVPAAKSGTSNWATSGYVLTGAGWAAGTKYNTDTTYAAATSAAAGLTKASYVDGSTLYVF